MTFNSLHIVDGYSLNTVNGSVYTSKWVKVGNASLASFHVVLTGGSPAGTLKLQQSNDIEVISSLNAAGNLVSALEYPQWAAPQTSGSFVDDHADCLSGRGQNTASVAAAGTFVLDQWFLSAGWLRVVFTASGTASTTLDIRATLKTE